MNRKTLALLIAVVTFTVGIAVTKLSLPLMRSDTGIPPMGQPDLMGNDYTLSGPYTYENLTIFLVHGPDQLNSKQFVPLQEALERKLVIVHETSDVNELSIENLAKTEEVFVQAGDIVKGGQQDRVLAVDLILSARSGNIPISAFCVENGRWQQRGHEATGLFSYSNDMLATKDLKVAARQAKSQTKVWREVDAAQTKLSASVRTDVRSEVSRSSLQLAVENDKVQESTASYIKELSSIVEGKSDVIGFVFAINGKINSADVYNTNNLFRRLWPKLLRTTAIEAVAERNSNEKKQTVTQNSILSFFADANRGQESTNEITHRTHMIKLESEKSLFFETRDMAQKGFWVHRSYIAK